MDVNQVKISGEVLKKSSLRKTGSGTEVLNVKIRCASGPREEEPQVFDCVVYGELAIALDETLYVRDSAEVRGRLSVSSWVVEGKRRAKVQIIANRFDVKKAV